MYLLDTPILIELRAARTPAAEPRLVAWAGAVARERLFVSALSLAEIEGMASRAGGLEPAAWREWIDLRLVPAFEGQVLAVDGAIARRRGTLGIADMRDALIAATAIEHGLTLVTRERAAYKGARVRLLDPSATPPADADMPAETEDWRSAGSGSGGTAWLRSLFIRG